VGLNPDDAVWDATVFTKNRERMMQGEIAQRLLETALGQARERDLLSEEHFTVDGTLMETWEEEKFIAELRRWKVVPHVAEYAPTPQWPNWLTDAERRDPGFAMSQKKRKLIESLQERFSLVGVGFAWAREFIQY
jgi:hypothetical protein